MLACAAIPGTGTVWVVPVADGPPQQVGPNFTAARHPIWSPDGKHLLIVGYTSAKAYEESSVDWWLVPTNVGSGSTQLPIARWMIPSRYSIFTGVRPIRVKDGLHE